MITANHTKLEKDIKIRLTKKCHAKNVTLLGAFPEGERLTFTLEVPRILGASGVVLRINPDGEPTLDLPFEFKDTSLGTDSYSVTLPLKKRGLYFYEFLFLRGVDTLFSSSVNNVDFTLSDKSESKFTLLVHSPSLSTPDFMKGGVMYHIFVDRFCRGKGEVTLHGRLNEDWENGIPQYAKKAGDPLSNDVFFGGNLWGVIEKLPYLKKLGVSIIYLSPIFESVSNHRYDTGDYEKIDSILGGDEAFDTLIKECHKHGMKVIIDGVFNHTGDNSRYFNRYGEYEEVGAYQSEDSPYHRWFNFTDFPDSYEAWWGIEIMPRLQHSEDNCRKYFTQNIAKKWLERGADGWRLDVADELSDTFLDEFCGEVKSHGNKAIIGEVWENAVTKISYGVRRKYFHGGQLDSVMNYPLRSAILALLTEGDTETFYNALTELYASYPLEISNSLMNIISTHDTERMLTLLGDKSAGEGRDNDELATLRMSKEKRREAISLLKIASVIQYTVFGFPSVYYGDEAGLEGYHDPFCRLPYPWGCEEEELIKHYKELGRLRRKHSCLKDGSFEFIYKDEDCIIYRRKKDKDSLTVAINVGDSEKSVKGMKIPPKSYIVK